MSAIPPHLPGTILQTTQVQQQASDIQKAERDAKKNAFRAEIRKVEQRDSTVSADDEDISVNSDGGGTGGQGRAFGEANEEAAAEGDDDLKDAGITVDDSGQFHLDLEA